jgi:hypothetical protein
MQEFFEQAAPVNTRRLPGQKSNGLACVPANEPQCHFNQPVPQAKAASSPLQAA